MQTPSEDDVTQGSSAPTVGSYTATVHRAIRDGLLIHAIRLALTKVVDGSDRDDVSGRV